MLNFPDSIRTRDCLDVVAALKELGCEVVHETQRHIFVCRGAVKMASVPKMMATGKAQREILAALEFWDADDLNRYCDAVARAAKPRTLTPVP